MTVQTNKILANMLGQQKRNKVSCSFQKHKGNYSVSRRVKFGLVLQRKRDVFDADDMFQYRNALPRWSS